jgi:hypothetical protein
LTFLTKAFRHISYNLYCPETEAKILPHDKPLPPSIWFPNSQQIQRRTAPAVEIIPLHVLKNKLIYNKNKSMKTLYRYGFWTRRVL